MNRDIVARAEDFLWSCFKYYLMSYQTCLLDLILKIKDEEATNPFDRYVDLANELDAHIGLGSYVNGQAAQFSKTPYITVNIQPIPMGDCTTRVVMGFDIVYSTDTPKAPDDMTRYIGSSSESVAAFRRAMVDALDQLFYRASGDEELSKFDEQAFYDVLYNKEVVNPTDPTDIREWDYNVIGQVNSEVTISEVTQLKREDRSVGLNLFHIVYTIDIDRLQTADEDFGC